MSEADQATKTAAGQDAGHDKADDPAVAAKWAAVGMGIGSAALVAALLYARRGRPKPGSRPRR